MRTHPRSTARAGWVGGLAAAALVLAGCGTVPAGPVGAAETQPPAATEAPTSATATPGATPTEAGPSTPSASPTTKPASDKAASTRPALLLEKGDKGEKVRDLQVRLRDLDWYSGSITGTYAASTVTGVKGFQGKRGLKKTGSVDATTWKQLTKRTSASTKDERHNVLRPGKAIYRQGSSGDKVRDLQARLKQIGWFSGSVTGTYGRATASGVKGFQGKRAIPVTGDVDARTWSRLTAMTRTPTEDAKHNRTPKPSKAGLDSRCLTGRAICISKSSNSLTWVVDGKPQLRMDVRFGAVGTPTREGTFSIQRKERDWTSTIYHSKMPYSMFFSGGQAVHYSSDFAARGYAGASHGCVNVRNLPALQTLFAQARTGDKVIVYR
ncbi:Peptidoglycan-binding (PGRP) domain of peptidoglycan hydrolases-containing protein [Microlunatus sagamiharensis]|uniref:Peptidoglycan-binding (PGRP) domain of peptidoglycan hydrolases-containing protein n=1 Tax=Microlunatus sagamiharensis TaxID=546874 RepID=A0A1H2N828_9ACTN|nr:peptidoglycan-binding protein [Microlunatus sagamiharensis]SDV01398.1 Peptidoglycan-binding (PGRP) domain of peptidoglycan hydrolases-containing protein [Microlunatus sagamiharensis]